MASNSASSEVHALPTPDELSQALKVDVYDKDGKTTTLGSLTQGKRTALIFIRHFWCLNCQVYLRRLSEAVPPANLPPNTQIIVVGCGSYQPINTYLANSGSQYPIHTDPTLRLHKLFHFHYNLAEAKAGDEQRDYMRGEGGAIARWWGGIKGALGSLQHINNVGPKSLNGGEVIVSAGGECKYIYRMQNTVDHTNISELAGLLDAKFDGFREEQSQKTCEDSCDVKS